MPTHQDAEIARGILVREIQEKSGAGSAGARLASSQGVAIRCDLGVSDGKQAAGRSISEEIPSMKSVELFTGAGGMALGLAKAGFEHLLVLERDPDSCATLRDNQAGNGPTARWPIVEADVRSFDFSWIPEGVDLIAAGVPCQPFSIGGKHRGPLDERNLFPEVARVVRKLRPKAILLENVRGLARPSFAKYFEYIRLLLTYPEIEPRSANWLDNLALLERYHTRGRRDGLYYRVVSRVLNAAEYGVPQRRERVFIVGIRADLGAEWSFPAPTHSMDALAWTQEATGDYWARHGLRPPRRDRSTPVASLNLLTPPALLPCRTVRDAMTGLPTLAARRGGAEPGLSHFLVPGARRYPGHTGSPLDLPAKTLKAGDHGVPGGENMAAFPDGKLRYFSIRESARLQTFPDEYTFSQSWTESMRQIGNAVPVALADIIGKRLRATIRAGTA